MLFTEGARARLDYVAYCNKPGSGNLPGSQDLGVPFRDAAATNDGKIKHGLLKLYNHAVRLTSPSKDDGSASHWDGRIAKHDFGRR